VVETFIAAELFESPAAEPMLMERICEWRNMDRALNRVVRNKGRPGPDGMTVAQLVKHVRRFGDQIRAELIADRYTASPVLRVHIPKANGGKRPLGIPTVLDRLVQQMVVQVLLPYWEPTFSEFSFGFRLKQSQHDAIRCARKFIGHGKEQCVVLDLKQFFDLVNQDRLMSRLATRIPDKRVLRLIRGFLQSGVLHGGVVSPTMKGVPQGGPLSPLLSNIVLDELDKELERRGLDFVRYADDILIFVNSRKAGERVLSSVSRYLQRKLKLQVNESKSGVHLPWRITHLGFSFSRVGGIVKLRVSRKALDRFRERVRELTARSQGRSLKHVIYKLNQYLRGWCGYYGHADQKSAIQKLQCWIRRRLRSLVWKHWKTRRHRVLELLRRGVHKHWARIVGCSRKGPWPMSGHGTVRQALPNALFDRLGLFQMV